MSIAVIKVEVYKPLTDESNFYDYIIRKNGNKYLQTIYQYSVKYGSNLLTNNVTPEKPAENLDFIVSTIVSKISSKTGDPINGRVEVIKGKKIRKIFPFGTEEKKGKSNDKHRLELIKCINKLF